MAIHFPSHLDALIEGFPPAFKATGVPQHKYVEDSQNVGEYIEKLFGRLSTLLFHIDKQINKVLIQGRFLPKKVNQWAMEARALKIQVSDLLKKQLNTKGDSLNSEDLVEMGIKMINHLKKCPCKDGMMYDKPIPVIMHRRELGSDKPSGRTEQKYSSGEKSYSNLKGKKTEHSQRKTDQSVDPVESHGLQDQEAGVMLTSVGTSSPAVELQKKNDVDTLVEKSGSELIPSESTEGAEIRREEASHVHEVLISPSDSDSVSISEDLSEERSAGKENSDILEDSETGMPRNMPTSVSDLKSLQTDESGSYGEIQVVDEGTTLTGAENLYIQQRDVTTEVVLKEKHYMVSVKEDHIKLKLDHHTILIADIRSSTQPESSPVLNLIEQNFRELPEKSDYCDSLALFVQRNYQLTLIHPSFFDSMPNLRFLDLSDTRIRILPSSLYRLPKLKVLMLSNCAGLENLPSDIGNLNQVEVLDLSGTTELYSLPDETGQLVLLRYMKLSFYGPDEESEFDHLPSQLVSPSILSELKELRALSITVHPDDHRWTDIASRILEEVGKLEMLSYLQFYFPKVEIFEDYIQMNQHKLSKFNFIVGHNVKRIVSRVPDEVESLFDQQDKCLRLVNGDKVTQLIKTALIQVTAFYLDHHTEIQSLSKFGISNFKALKFCVVRECPKIQAIMDEKTDEGAFPCLEHLGVYYLWELKHIWKPPSPPGRLKRILKTPVPCGHFKALKCLVVIACPKLQFILWGSMLQCLSNLEELVVKDCEKVEKIIKEEKKKVKYDDVILPGLRKLVLHYLPDLVSLGNGLRLSIEKVDVHGCPKLILKPQAQ
ncbi:hypothetical protein ACS0TY_025732 [Phlomoides rotata]